ncbi:MAG: hypothetical protein AAF936_04750 [Pseudomonadota bacterium]
MYKPFHHIAPFCVTMMGMKKVCREKLAFAKQWVGREAQQVRSNSRKRLQRLENFFLKMFSTGRMPGVITAAEHAGVSRDGDLNRRR